MTTFVDPALIEFFKQNPIEKRRAVSSRLLTHYPDRVPVIVGRAQTRNTPDIDKHKFIVPREITFGNFMLDVRKHVPTLYPSTGLLFFLSDNTLPQTSALMSTLYEKHKSDDGFLYLTYSCESTFGYFDSTS